MKVVGRSLGHSAVMLLGSVHFASCSESQPDRNSLGMGIMSISGGLSVH